MIAANDVQRLESERLRPTPPGHRNSPMPLDLLFRELLDLIAGECRRSGLLPPLEPHG